MRKWKEGGGGETKMGNEERAICNVTSHVLCVCGKAGRQVGPSGRSKGDVYFAYRHHSDMRQKPLRF